MLCCMHLHAGFLIRTYFVALAVLQLATKCNYSERIVTSAGEVLVRYLHIDLLDLAVL